MHDLFEEDLVTWRALEGVTRDTFLAYGYGEIRTPIVEEEALFVRGVGEGTDMVGKEMYVFPDRDPNSPRLCLRPENTAGVVRAMIEHGKIVADAFHKVFYLGQQFRNERPQAGRYRQFSQLGCEVLGYAEPAADVEVIALAHTLLQRLGVTGVTLLLSTLGDAGEDRQRYNAALRSYLGARQDELSEDSRRRLDTNPLRILDSKDRGDQRLVAEAPKPVDFLSEAARAHFEEVKAGLDRLGIAYVLEPKLVRGIDYYTRTVFELVGEAGLGAQSTVAAGGRYDGLVADLGGRPTPAVGFAAGIDRLILVMKALGQARAPIAPELMIIAADAEGQGLAQRLAFALRAAGRRVEADLKGRSVKAQMRHADRSGARFTMVLGSREIAEGRADLKAMATGAVQAISLDAAALSAALDG
jgi:histidyl-tRNA synthetase